MADSSCFKKQMHLKYFQHLFNEISYELYGILLIRFRFPFNFIAGREIAFTQGSFFAGVRLAKMYLMPFYSAVSSFTRLQVMKCVVEW